MGFLSSLLCLEEFSAITNFSTFIAWLDSLVWGPLMLILIVGTGVFLTVRLKFRPWRNLGYALRSIFDKKKDKSSGDISSFQSLMTALSATVGVGNIAGVATAMVAGGPGALVWMWLTAVVGLSTKYAESMIAVKYRVVNDRGEMAGGAMFALRDGLKNKTLGKVLAFLFALFGICASFGIGNMTQSNTVSASVASLPCFSDLGHFTFLGNQITAVNVFVGVILVLFCLIVIIGGIKKIGAVTGVVVPFMAVLYFCVGILAILLNIKNIPSGLYNIFVGAFAPQCIMDGVLGNVIATAIQKGVARGVFSNEAGLGSAPIAAAAAKTDHPARQGYVNMTGTFIDTIIICTLTALVILCSGTAITYGQAAGAELTISGFTLTYGGWVSILTAVAMCCFAFSTILGWGLYGARCIEFLFSSKVVKPFMIVYSLVAILGSTTDLGLMWSIAETFNGLMAIPNLIALFLLSGTVARLTREYFEKRRRSPEAVE